MGVGAGRSWEALGFHPKMTTSFILILTGLVVGIAVAALRRSKILDNASTLAKVHGQIKTAHLERMLPHTRAELMWFSTLSITAGICEELLYRGYLIWYLRSDCGVILALVLAAFAFGIGHAYQGIHGVVLTTIAGLILGGLYLATGFILLPMIVHALTDLHSGHIGYVALNRSESQVALTA